MSEQKFKALREGDSLDFWGLKDPKCPHCGHEISVSDNELWRLYEEGEHELECSRCDGEFSVSTRVSYSFSTDEQEQDEEDVPMGDPDEHDFDEDEEPACDRCHGDGRDPWNDYLLPCPECQGEQQP